MGKKEEERVEEEKEEEEEKQTRGGMREGAKRSRETKLPGQRSFAHQGSTV